jgi:hypothetical protein
MKPIIVENSKIPKLLSLVIQIGAITLWPFIFFRDDADEITVNHESIHIAQYNELFVIGFLFLYCFDYINGLIKYKNKVTAYYNIRFEKEAYEFELDLKYLEKREKYSWRKYSV